MSCTICEGPCVCGGPESSARREALYLSDRDALAGRLRALALPALADLLCTCGLSLVCEPPALALLSGLVQELEERTVERAALRAAGAEALEVLGAGLTPTDGDAWPPCVVGAIDEADARGACVLLSVALRRSP